MLEQEKKWCRECNEIKDIENFSPNQFGKNNRIIRRPVCKGCYKKKKKINRKDKKIFLETNPKPEIGQNFNCPICDKTFIREYSNDVVLDHCHKTGTIRGWVCNSCNTSIGKFNDDIKILTRAIDWIKKTS